MKFKKKIILLIILVSYIIILIDNSLIFTGSLNIERDLNLTQTGLSWVSNIYAISFGGFLLVSSKAGDIWGRKFIFTIGLIVFGIGSFLVGISSNFIMILLSRAFQGFGSSILAPTSMAILLDTFKSDEQNKAIAYYGATAGIGTAIGLVLGGFFSSLLSWRVGFYINIPITLILFILAKRFLKNIEKKTDEKLDLLGALLSILMIITLVYGIVGHYYRYIFFLISLVFWVSFILVENFSKHPMLPLSFFDSKERVGAYIARFFYMGSLLSLSFRLPQLLQNVFNLNPLMAGLGMLPFSMTIFCVALLQPKLSQSISNVKLMLVGSAISTMGILVLCFFSSDSGYILGIAIPTVIVGMGQGITLSPLTIYGVKNVEDEYKGEASGVVNVVHQMGMAVGLALVVSFSRNSNSFIEVFSSGMVVTLILCFISFLSILFIIYPTSKTQ